MTNLSEPLSMHRKHRHWRMMAGHPGEPFRLNASPGVSSRVRRASSQCRCRCSLQLSATSCRLPSPAVVALDSLRRRSQHDAIGATKAPLVEEGRVPGVRYRAIAAEGGVIKETAAWAVFKLRSGALFSRGHEEGRDWPRSVHELGVPQESGFESVEPEKTTIRPTTPTVSVLRRKTSTVERGKYSAPVRVRKTVSVLSWHFSTITVALRGGRPSFRQPFPTPTTIPVPPAAGTVPVSRTSVDDWAPHPSLARPILGRGGRGRSGRPGGSGIWHHRSPGGGGRRARYQPRA